MKRLLPLLLAAGLLAACTDDPATTPSASTAAPEASPSAEQTAAVPTAAPSTVPTTAGPASSPSATGGVAFPADTRPDTEAATGGPLTVVSARASRQEGFDRVVLQLAGKQAGAPGWRVEYVDEPTQDGSGDKVDVEGDAVLQVVVTGVGYPFDTGQEEASNDLAPKGTRTVREVDLQATFEGQFTAFVGLSRKVPFRVTRLSDPARVVIDVRDS
ncbi:MAG: hypothetical protein JWO60_2291 [Frankiales bacterium]|nr:hypothetical protein [Frankiales bacterium]